MIPIEKKLARASLERCVGSAGASPSQGPSSGREGEAPADPELQAHSVLNWCWNPIQNRHMPFLQITGSFS